jgi:hypothetical protein
MSNKIEEAYLRALPNELKTLAELLHELRVTIAYGTRGNIPAEELLSALLPVLQPLLRVAPNRLLQTAELVRWLNSARSRLTGTACDLVRWKGRTMRKPDPAVTEETRRILALRKANKSWGQIGRALDISADAARKRVQRWKKKPGK